MRKDLIAKINKMLVSKAHRKTFLKVVSSLMAVVVFCTTYALILPALTLEHKTYCGLEEHTHTDECLAVPTVVQSLICQPDADYVLHTHDDNCYYRGELICTLPEYTAHTHTEDCYAQVRELSCGQTEREEHYHTDDCYVTINNLICNQEEKEGHTHTEDCYVYTQTLVCGLNEDENHTHTEDCYAQNPELICGKEEEEGHTHTEDCYVRSTEQICEKREGEGHTHTDECYTMVDKLKCKELELIPHVHSESCYTDGELTCGLPQVISHQHDDSCMGEKLVNTEADTSNEKEIYSCNPTEGVDFVVHTHDEYCYNDNGELVCTLDERKLHTHDESCYDEDGNLTCTQPEIVLHTHSDECLVDDILACGLPIVTEHQHDLDCVDVAAMAADDDDKYICGLEEHTHSDECYVAPDGLKFDFTVEDQGVSGYITIDWSDELPDDLECTVVVMQGYEDDYDAMYQAAADSVTLTDSELNEIKLYQIEWTSNGEEYTLPEGLNPQICLNVEKDDDLGEVEQITGVVITPKTEDEVENQTVTQSGNSTGIAANANEIGSIDYSQENQEPVKVSEEANTILANAAAADSSYSPKLVLLSAEDVSTDSSDAIVLNSDTAADYTDSDVDSYAAAPAAASLDDDNSTDDTDADQTHSYSGIAQTADDSGVMTMSLDSNTVAVAKTRKFSTTGNVGYYSRVTSESQLTSGGQYIFLFANGDMLMASNNYKFGSNTGNAATFYDPIFVASHEVTTASGAKYFVFTNGEDSYVKPGSKYNLYHWTISATTANTSDYSLGTAYSNSYNYSLSHIDIDEFQAGGENPSNIYKITNSSTGYPLWVGYDYIYSTDCRYSTGINIMYNKYYNAWHMGGVTAGTYNESLSDTSEGYYFFERYFLLGSDPADYTMGQHAWALSMAGTAQTRYEYQKYENNILIYKYEGTSIDTMDDETLAGTKENVEIIKEENTNTYENDVSSITDKGLTGTDSDNLSQLASSVLQYASDPASSLIKEEYSFLDQDPATMDSTELLKLQQDNDGRVVTDKSVIYRKDDYDAFDEDDYGQGDFSVTLSAIGQEWSVKENLDSTVPVDVMFILDLSGSMTSTYNGEYRWISSVSALNYIGEELMERNSQNRMGLVVFSNAAYEILPMAHYTASADDIANGMPFLTYSLGYNSYSDSYTVPELSVSSGLTGATITNTNMNDVVPSDTTGCVGQSLWSATFTQQGLERAYETMAKVSDTTAKIKVYDDDGNVTEKTVTRQPVIVLLSDGDPTLCSTDYMDPTNGPMYGSGSSVTLFGYYTVLSANYFKNMTSIHYGKVADMYTIALGLNPDSYPYAMAVLNPDKTNLDKLLSSSTYSTLTNLLSSSSYKLRLGATGWSDDYYLPLYADHRPSDYLTAADAMNPYTNYDYADGTYYGEMTEEKLEAIFTSILNQVQSSLSYSFLLEENTNVTFTDEIGDGMTVKGDPVLRYDGVNLDNAKRVKSAVKYTSDGRPYTEYYWTGTITHLNNSTGKEETVNLSGIKARVYQTYESADGKVSYTNETVEFSIPEKLLPVYYPSKAQEFYYEADPVRLIYMVGLSDDELDSIAADTSEIKDKVYYTSQYDSNNQDGTTVTFTPAVTDPKTGKVISSATTGETVVNPYYTTANMASAAVTVKSENTTNTAAYSFYESLYSVANSKAKNVTQHLGNNGKLTLNRPEISNITVNKDWATPGTETDSVTVRLYASGTMQKTGSTTTTNGVWCLGEKTLKASDKDSENWTGLWSALPEKEIIGDYTYTYTDFYVREVSANQKNTDVSSKYEISYKDADDKDISVTTLTLTTPNADYQKVHPVLDGASTVTAALANSGEVTIVNAQMYTLPHTGGTGAEPYYVAGVMLIMLSSTAMLFRKTRRREE
jgi:LPXTG-motif cell wall-anchored protein